MMEDSSVNQNTQQFRYSFLKIMTGSDLSRRRLPVMEATSGNEGPVVWLTACAHGDEVGGMVIIQEIFKMLKKKKLHKGAIHAFPLMNPIGYESGTRNIPFSKEDLNRSFPGNPGGSLAERMAYIIFSTILGTKTSLVIDLHNDWIRSLPYAMLDPMLNERGTYFNERLKRISQSTGLPVVCEEDNEESKGWEKTLSGSLVSRGIPALTLELGESFVVNERNVEHGVKAIWNLLTVHGMVESNEPPFNYYLPEECQGKFLRYSHQPVTSKSGIIRFLVKPGQIVHAGQPVARIYNAFGKLQETLRAPIRSLVIGSADSSVAYPGIPVIAFGQF